MTEPVTVDYLTQAPQGPLVRFTGTPTAIAALRDAFDQLANGEPVALQGLRLRGLSSLTLRHDTHGGLHATTPDRLTYDGDSDQWTSRARLLDQLAHPPNAFQYLDYDSADELAAVVTTYPDGSF